MRVAAAGPTHPVREVLARFRGARVIFPPHVDDRGVYLGNNGDLLILAGVDRLFRSLDIEVVTSEDRADLVVMCGGGGLRERWRWIHEILRDCCQRLRHLPLIVLPSSFDFPTYPLANTIGNRTAPVTLYCRDAYSYLHLLRDHTLPACCRVEIDHDMAFEMASTRLVTRLRAVKAQDVLMVERADSEHPDLDFKPRESGKARFVKRLIPAALRPLAWRARSALRAKRSTPFRTSCEELLRTNYQEFNALPRRIVDISNPSAGNFESFCDVVSRASIVFTTRLHAGILASMLDRATVFFEGPYHKIRGVYEFSLRDRLNVRLAKLQNPPS